MQNEFKKYFITFIKLLFVAFIVGIFSGLIGSAFSLSITYVTKLRNDYPWLLYLLPIGGITIIFIYKLFDMEKIGTNNIIDSIFSGNGVSYKLIPAIFSGTAITHLFGGSSGREGAALQIGGSIGATISKIIKLDDKDTRLTIMCGMSAVFAALFGTPIAATIFSMEVISVGIVHYSALFPCLVASLTATYVTSLFNVSGEKFAINIPEFSYMILFKVAFIAILCAYLSIFLCLSLHKSEHFFKEKIKNPYFRIIIGGLIIILLTLIVNSRDYNGAGMNIIANAVEQGEVIPYAFLLKLVFTCVTLSSGYKGGEVVPTLFIGSTFGCLMAQLIGLEPTLGASVGMIALFCGATNTPIASLLLGIEFFGSNGLIYFGLACFISYLLSDRYSLYHSQKIMYSKLKPEFINAETK